jgi:hypothetical protein
MDKKESKKGYWYYDPAKTCPDRRYLYSQHRSLLYNVLYRALTRHDLRQSFWLLELLPKCPTIDCYVVFRYVMIILNTLETRKINKNFIIYLESLLSKLAVSAPDVFVELISYLFSNNRIDDARELYCQRHKFMSYHIHRNVPLQDVNVSCYGFLLNYLEWKERLPSENKMDFDVSTQGWLVNGMDALKAVEHNYEIFVFCIVNVLLYHGFWKKAYLFTSEFQRTNPRNLSAQLLLLNLIENRTTNGPKRRRLLVNYMDLTSNEEEKKREENRYTELLAINNFSAEECKSSIRYDQFPILTDKKNILDRLQRLDPTRDELIELSATYLAKAETIRLLMDSLEHVSKVRDFSRWRCLQNNLDEVICSNDPNLMRDVSNLWLTRYKRFWRVEHFLLLLSDEASRNRAKHEKTIRDVIHTLSSRFDQEETL